MGVVVFKDHQWFLGIPNLFISQLLPHSYTLWRLTELLTVRGILQLKVMAPGPVYMLFPVLLITYWATASSLALRTQESGYVFLEPFLNCLYLLFLTLHSHPGWSWSCCTVYDFSWYISRYTEITQGFDLFSSLHLNSLRQGKFLSLVLHSVPGSWSKIKCWMDEGIQHKITIDWISTLFKQLWIWAPGKTMESKKLTWHHLSYGLYSVGGAGMS